MIGFRLLLLSWSVQSIISYIELGDMSAYLYTLIRNSASRERNEMDGFSEDILFVYASLQLAGLLLIFSGVVRADKNQISSVSPDKR